jgi:hypothetical protein
MTCANHLKQIGIGIHTYHDAHSALVPVAIFANRPSWLALLYPYIEQNGLYEALNSIELNPTMAAPRYAPLTFNGNNNTDIGLWFVNALKNPSNNPLDKSNYLYYRQAFGSVETYQCPDRRAGASYVDNSPPSPSDPTGSNDNNNGPRGDYAAVSVFDPTGAAPDYSHWFRQVSLYAYWQSSVHPGGVNTTKDYYRYAKPTSSDLNSSPLRLPLLTFANDNGAPWSATGSNPKHYLGVDGGDSRYILTWESRDTFGWLEDGTSNQLVAGEKFIPTEFINKTPKFNNEAQWDGGYFAAHSVHGSMNMARMIWKDIPPIKRHGRDTLDVHGQGVLPDAWFGTGTSHDSVHREAVFGSSHGANANFLRADGTVTLITADVNWTTIWQLGKVNDGAAVNVP